MSVGSNMQKPTCKPWEQLHAHCSLEALQDLLSRAMKKALVLPYILQRNYFFPLYLIIWDVLEEDAHVRVLFTPIQNQERLYFTYSLGKTCLIFFQAMVSHPVQSTSSISATSDINPPLSLHSKILPPTQMWYILTVPQISSFSAWPSPSSAQPYSVSPFGRQSHIFFLLLLFFSLLSAHCISHWKILPSPLTTRSTQFISCRIHSYSLPPELSTNTIQL